jgi:para-nitrobenzyl esterase
MFHAGGAVSGQEIVSTAQGRLQGRRDGDVIAFLGVPYAAPPFGANRLQPPVPPSPWDGVRAATELGPTVPKADYVPMYVPLFPEVAIPGEDCLNLNIWTPAVGSQGLPVLVWIHGGAFTNGSNSIPEYNGSAFARDGVVTVAINYRLAAEGFLYTGEGTANLGLLDQVAALRWVRDNIAAFGGDPQRVTVAGESAGAWSVNTLLATPRAAGLFQQAISASGGAQHYLQPEQGLLVARELAAALGVEPVRAAFATLPPDRIALACRELITEVQTAPDPAKWGSLALSQQPYVPTVDGDVLPRPTLEAIAAGHGADVALLIGTTADEARLILVAAGVIDQIDDAALAQAAAGYGLPAEAVAVYRANRPQASPGDLLSAIVSDWYFRIPSVRVAEARGSGTWMYRWDWASPTLGSGHGVDIPFVFDTLASPGLAVRLGEHPPQAVADTTHGTWVEFITKGEPGWNPYDTATRTTALITDAIRTASDPGGDERLLWAGRR